MDETRARFEQVIRPSPRRRLDTARATLLGEQAVEMTRRPVADRFLMATALGSEGDFGTALQALYDPSSVTPAHQREASELWDVPGLSKEVEDSGWYNLTKRLVSNPLMWAGLAATLVFPVAGRAQIQRSLKVVKDYSRQLGFFEKWLSGADELLRTKKGAPTPMHELIIGGAEAEARMKDRASRLMTKAVESFRKLEGRDPAEKEWHELAIHAERWWDRSSPQWKRQWGKIEEETGKRLEFFRPTLSDGQEELLKGYDAVRKMQYEAVFGKLSKEQFTKLRNEMVEQGMTPHLPTKEDIGTYMPHVVDQDAALVQKQIKFLASLPENIGTEQAVALMQGRGWAANKPLSPKQFKAMQKRGFIPGSVKSRVFAYVPSEKSIANLREYMTPDTEDALKEVLRRGNRMVGDEERIVVPFTTNVASATSRYIHGMSKFRAWTLEGRSKRIRTELEEMRQSSPDLAMLVDDVWEPMAKGQMTPKEYTRNLAWGVKKVNAIRFLQTNKLLRSSEAGKQVADKVTDWILSSSALKTRMSAENAAASWLYLGALGGNLSSAFNNLMQTIGTTAPRLGFGATMQGTLEFGKRSGRFFRLLGKGIDKERAWERAFPEMARSGLEGSSALGHEVFSTLLRNWENAGALSGARTVAERVRMALMMPFQAAEKTNRGVAFYSALARGKAEGFSRAERIAFGRQIVEETQFLGGGLLRPAGITQFGPLGRQFLGYPLKLAGYYWQGLKRGNVGMLGRSIVGGTAAYEGFRELAGMDISPSLPWEGLPLPTEGRPFSPFPVLPPVLSIPGAVAMDLAKGEFNKSQSALPMLVPGGLAATRAAAMFSETAARYSNKKYADYGARDEAGRIPMYTGEGQFLGSYTPFQVYAQALGFRVGDVVQEEEAMKYLKKQRDIYRDARREILEAYANNQGTRYQRSVERFKKMYPGLPLPVKPSDIRAIDERRTMSRLELFGRTLPSEIRPMFQQALGVGAAQNMGALSGVGEVRGRYRAASEPGMRLQQVTGRDLLSE